MMMALLCSASLAVFWGLHTMTLPTFGPVQYAVDGQESTEGKIPLSFPSRGNTISVDVPVTISQLTPRSLSIRPDDCLDTLKVNGIPVATDILPFCDYTRGRTLDLHAYLHSGENILTLSIRDHGGMGGIDIRPPYNHPLLLAIMTGWITILALSLWALLRSLPLSPFARPIAITVTMGGLLRLFYLLHTPYTLRGHDADGHLEYVQYILSHWTLPDAHGGWEFYQPPLYYLLGTFWIGLSRVSGLTLSPAILLQILSLILTTAALAVSGTLALRLFRDRFSPILFTLLLATLPSAIFFAARTNNDVLFLLLGTVSIFLLLRWWEHPRTSTWYLFVTTVGFNLLTKFNAVLLLPCLLLPFVHHKNIRANLERTVASCFILLLIAGWFYLPRALTEERPGTLVIGNIGNLSSELRVPNSFPSLATFNPFKFLSHPFNNAWSDAGRRQYFWEYFFRSAFFGEFGYDPSFRPLAIMIIILALVLIPIALFGVWSSLRSHAHGATPLFHLLWTGLLGSLAYRILFPFASSQDFRYAILLVIPVTFFLVHGIVSLPKTLRRIAHITTLTFAGLCTAFTIGISILP